MVSIWLTSTFTFGHLYADDFARVHCVYGSQLLRATSSDLMGWGLTQCHRNILLNELTHICKNNLQSSSQQQQHSSGFNSSCAAEYNYPAAPSLSSSRFGIGTSSAAVTLPPLPAANKPVFKRTISDLSLISSHTTATAPLGLACTGKGKDDIPETLDGKKITANDVNLTHFRRYMARLFDKRELWRGLFAFILTFSLYITIVTMQFGIVQSFELTDALEVELVGKTTSKKIAWRDIDTIPNWFDWVENAMLPVLFEAEYYNHEEIPPSRRFMVGETNKLVGGFHFTQTRRKNWGGCFNSTRFGSLIADNCYHEGYPDEAPFGPCAVSRRGGASGSSGNSSSECGGIDPDIIDAFKYSCDSHGICGYQMAFELSHNMSWDFEKIEELKQYRSTCTHYLSFRSTLALTCQCPRWIDDATEEVLIDLTFWNNNEKLWVTVALDTFISLAGRVKTKVFYSTFVLDPYDWHNYLVIERSVFEIAFVMCILYLTAVEIQQIYAAYRRGEMEQLDHFTGLAFWVPPGIHWYYLDGETGKFNYSDLLQLSLYYTQVVATYTPWSSHVPS